MCVDYFQEQFDDKENIVQIIPLDIKDQFNHP